MAQRSARTATATPEPVARAVDLERYRRDGYLVLRSVIGEEDLVELRSEVDRLSHVLAEDPESWGHSVDWERDATGAPVRGGAIARIEPLIDLSPAFAALAADPRITGPAERIFDDGVELFEDKLNLKLPGGGGFPWHQDWSCCWRAHTDDLVTCFLSLDDTTPENGPLQVIPGSHTPRACLPFNEAFDPVIGPDFEVDPREISEQRSVTPDLRAGDMIVFDPYLLHYSDRNASDRPRRTIIYTYGPQRLGRLYRYAPLAAGRAEQVAAAFA